MIMRINRNEDISGKLFFIFTVIIISFFIGYLSGRSNQNPPEVIEKTITVEKEVKVNNPQVTDNTNLCKYAAYYRYIYWYFTVDGLHRRPGETKADMDKLGELLGISDELNSTVCK